MANLWNGVSCEGVIIGDTSPYIKGEFYRKHVTILLHNNRLTYL